MKFNDKEMGQWAASFTPDKEGLLEKKGATKGQGYKQRWFRLKGNMLFYFRVDETGDWQSTGDPLGVIILERCSVEAMQHDTRPYTFTLMFQEDASRTYILSAFSEPELRSWITAIQTASYEGLRAQLYQLQNEILTLSGEDPLRDVYVGNPRPKAKAKNLEVKHSVYIKSSNKIRAKKLSSLALPPSLTGPKYELGLSCCNLQPVASGRAPNTMVRVRVYASPVDHSASTVLSQTEVIESSTSPCYSHLVLLDTGPQCPSSALLEFEVFMVDYSVPESELESCPLESDAVFWTDDKTRDLTVGKRIGRAECQVSAVTASEGKELKLALSESSPLVCGFLHVMASRVDDVLPSSPKKNAPAPLDLSSPLGVLPSVLSHPTCCHFCFRTTIQGKRGRVKVIEEMAESTFNLQVPIELLKCYITEDQDLLSELVSIGALVDGWLDSLHLHQIMLSESVAYYKHAYKQLEAMGDTCGFKKSTAKKSESLRFVPCNLHIQRMRAKATGKERAYSTVTFGCPADHVTGFKNGGGLKKLLADYKTSPSFVSQSGAGKAPSIRRCMARLIEIKSKILEHNNALYRASANASPRDMNVAMTGISQEIQQLLHIMQSVLLAESIESLINARPVPGGGGDPPISPQSKRVSLKRRSAAGLVGAAGKCCCGKCCRCVPSPSDWIWNGSSLVQVSNRDWKMPDSISSIQRSLVNLIESVEMATKRVVEQQHEAVASEVGLTFSTFKPTYVWSLDLIPMFVRLNQTLEGLFKVSLSSLTFALIQADSFVDKLRVLKWRRDVVVSQALTALVTSFYLLLSHNFTDKVFLHQIQTIGFLAQFESLLTSLGEESGMIEDMYIAVAELGAVSFQLAELRGDEELNFDFVIRGTRDCLTVQFLLSKQFLAALPNKELKSGALIPVVPVLFTQGVNEKQTLANLKNEVRLQEEINSRGLSTLSEYVGKYEKIMSKFDTSQSRLSVTSANSYLEIIKKSYSSHKSKNIEFLLTIEQLVQSLRGGRLTSCKSGKDRTGMSVTLEECTSLRSHYHIDSDSFSKTLATLRSHGTRLENCYRNTGHRCYHFNQLQLMLLPKLLTPPPYTCRDPE